MKKIKFPNFDGYCVFPVCSSTITTKRLVYYNRSNGGLKMLLYDHYGRGYIHELGFGFTYSQAITRLYEFLKSRNLKGILLDELTNDFMKGVSR